MMCSAACAGYRDDQPGSAPSFCAALTGVDTGLCLPRAHALNDECRAIAGATLIEADRYLGDAPPARISVCAPAALAPAALAPSFAGASPAPR